MHQIVNNISSFLYMSGYAGFIWPAYIAMLLVFAVSMILPLRQFRKIKKDLRSKN